MPLRWPNVLGSRRLVCGKRVIVGHYPIMSKAAEADLIALSMCQSDSMVVPLAAKKIILVPTDCLAAPRKHGAPVVFDMATTVQAWGKILDARSKDKEIPATWAVDAHGKPTTNPHHVHGCCQSQDQRLWVDDDGGYLVWNAPLPLASMFPLCTTI